MAIDLKAALIRVQSINTVSSKTLHDSFVQFVYADKAMKKNFADLSEVEDLFDYSYLEDASATRVAEFFDKVPSVAKASKEAFSRAKWCIDNIDSEHKKNKSALLLLAKSWADSVAPEIVRLAKLYVDL